MRKELPIEPAQSALLLEAISAMAKIQHEFDILYSGILAGTGEVPPAQLIDVKARSIIVEVLTPPNRAARRSQPKKARKS